MAGLRVPIICVIIGEGGSGGALGIGVGDRLLMLEHSYYSVISPEGCSAILWKNSGFKEKAAEILKLTATDLKDLGVLDEIVPEPLGGAHRDPGSMARALRDSLLTHLRALENLSGDEIVQQRYEKLKGMGIFEETAVEQLTTSGAGGS